MGRFGNVITAMVTPFDENEALDLDAAQTLARWLVDHGNQGLTIAGTTGESPALSHDEQIDLIAAVVEAVDVPVIAGAGSNDTRAAVELTERATAAGASAILSVTPYYNRPSQAGIVHHFSAVASATELPVVLYDIPGRTGRKISTDTLLELAHDISNISALKDAAGDVAATAEFIGAMPDDFEVYSGEDKLNLPLLSVGAVGFISVASHWVGLELSEMVEAFASGDIDRARTINQMLIPSYNFETGDDAPNPIPSKSILREAGLPVGHPRSPMVGEPDSLSATARFVLAGTAVGRELGVE